MVSLTGCIISFTTFTLSFVKISVCIGSYVFNTTEYGSNFVVSASILEFTITDLLPPTFIRTFKFFVSIEL